jgi:hypothetical protein
MHQVVLQSFFLLLISFKPGILLSRIYLCGDHADVTL